MPETWFHVLLSGWTAWLWSETMRNICNKFSLAQTSSSQFNGATLSGAYMFASITSGQMCQPFLVGCLEVRCACSVALTLFQLGDSCRTTSHRDYLMKLGSIGSCFPSQPSCSYGWVIQSTWRFSPCCAGSTSVGRWLWMQRLPKLWPMACVFCISLGAAFLSWG